VIVDGQFIPPNHRGDVIAGTILPRQVLPTFVCFIDIPALGCRNIARLLLDTGGEQTSIMPTLGQSLHIPYRRLTYPLSSGGLGRASYCEFDAVVSFIDRMKQQKDYPIKIAIFDPSPFIGRRNYSLLGRDIVHEWKVVYDYPNDQLFAEV
jgi:hypothetical protein